MGTSFAEYTIPIIWETVMRKKTESRKLRNGGKAGGLTHDTIDCHDLAENDTVCKGAF